MSVSSEEGVLNTEREREVRGIEGERRNTALLWQSGREAGREESLRLSM